VLPPILYEPGGTGLFGKGRAAQAASAEPKGRSEAPLADPAGEIRRLQRENEYLRRQREILKKSYEHTLGGTAERYALIDSMRKNFPITELCEALSVSRSGYYELRKREPSKRTRANEQLLHQMRTIDSDRHTRCYGSPRMTRELRAVGIACSENRVARIMRSNGLRARPRRAFRPKTTQPDHAAHPSPNLLSEAGPPSVPG
jgi:putative transposase